MSDIQQFYLNLLEEALQAQREELLDKMLKFSNSLDDGIQPFGNRHVSGREWIEWFIKEFRQQQKDKLKEQEK